MMISDSLEEVRIFKNLVYRDIKERGRQVDKVIARYHKFVKPAFDEYIKPVSFIILIQTRKLADVIIPRGAENFVAIQLVSQYSKMLINRFYPKQDSAAPSEIEFTHNDIIDPRYQYFNNKIIVPEGEIIEVLKDILGDFINGKRMTYYKMFLEELVNSIIKLYVKNSEMGDATVINEFTDLNKFQAGKKVVYFKPFIMSDMDLVQTE